MAPVLRYQTSVVNLVLVCQLPFLVYGFPHWAEESTPMGKEKVFTNREDASQYIRRHLLYNQFDFEMIVPGNLERECYEEICNYEEAREVFEDPDTAMAFWQKYTSKDSKDVVKLDVVGLLTGIISGGTLLVILGLLGYYWYMVYCAPRRHRNVQDGSIEDRHISNNSRSSEELPLQPTAPLQLPPPPYDEVVLDARNDEPPPPYPGTQKKSFKKSLSIPAHQKYPL
ncbi:transmembrane gamma-carboxyglutamic acid protein 4-like [Xenopus laevis]|uniref:Transmembrane gamma-carboxyglutamic acid protein 4-like n=1 Tax=Xenopus laevis TaxID=8355 RepID=A0A8J1MXX1_XENLA|nr:transmembrane gamma-carboxyglutamic acid protein 4-like [Xenopus laevis]